MTVPRHKRLLTAAVGGATIATSIAAPFAAAVAATHQDPAPNPSVRGHFTDTVDADPNVIAARKAQLAAHKALAARLAAYKKAAAAYKKNKTPATKKKYLAAKKAYLKAKAASDSADSSALIAAVMAMDVARRGGTPILPAPPVEDTPVEEEEAEIVLPTPGIWGSAGDTVVEIGWAPGDGENSELVTGYRIERNGAAIDMVDAGHRSMSDGPLENNHTYTYSVTALGADGARSAPASINLTPGDFEAPEAPILDGSAADSSVILGITPPLDAETFRIYQNGALIDTIAATESNYTVTGLTNGTAYSFTVTALDLAGNESVASNQVDLTPVDLTAPDVPVLSGGAGNAEASLSWTASADAAEYRIYKDGILVTSVPTGTLTYTVTGLVNSTSYDFMITAVDSTGNESAPSSIITLTPAVGADSTPPDPVTSLTVTAAANGSVTLNWTGPLDAASYDVYKTPAGGTATFVGSSTSPTLTIPGLTDGTLYTFTVQARDAAGNVSTPTTVDATPADTIAPNAPSVFASPGAGKADLTWFGDIDTDQWLVYQNGVLINTLPAGTTALTVSGLTGGVTYSFTVKAQDAAGNISAASSVVTATPTAAADLTPPDVPVAALSSAGNGQATITFSGSSDTAQWLVYQNGSLLATVSGSASSYTATGLTDGATYSFTVAAKDAAGNISPPSNSVTATPADTIAPGTPTLSGTAGDTEVYLSWLGDADVVSWDLYQDSVLIGTYSGGSSTATVTGLENDTIYGFSVKAKDAAGNESGFSSVALLTPVAAAAPPDTTPPAVPTAHVDSAANGQAQISWTADPDVAQWLVYKNGTLVQTYGSGTTSHTATGLTNGVSYSFTVAAKDAAGNTSAQSSTVTATPADTIAPGTPTISGIEGDTEAYISWLGDADVASWDLYQNSVLIGTFTGSTTTTTVTGLTNDTPYVFTVVAKDAAGNASPTSNAATVTPVAPYIPPPPDTTPPAVPVVTVNSASSNNGQVVVNWADDADVAQFLIYQNGTLVQTLPAGSTTYTATGLADGTTYTFRVAAKDAAGNTSAQSIAVTATPADTIAPNVPTGLVGAAGTGVANLSWSGPVDAISYKVYKNGTLLTTTANTSYTATGLTGGTAYSFQVSAVDAAGNESAKTAAVSVTPTAALLAAPTLTAGTAYNSTANVSWAAVSGAASYTVYKNGIIVASGITATSTTITGLTNGTAYSITVKAVDSSGTAGTASNAVSVTPIADTAAPAKPVITGGIRGAGSVTLTWTESSADATEYDVYYGTSTTTITTLAGTTTSKSYKVTGLTPGTKYYFAVKAKDAAGNVSAASSSWAEGPAAAGLVNGTFSGTAVDNGHSLKIQVVLTVVDSEITSVSVPNTWAGKSTSQGINDSAIPKYNAETITSQTATIAKVSGATDTYTAYKSSLSSALTAAGLP